MPIDTAIYAVTFDGRIIQRGLTEAQAYAHANYVANGFNGKRASDKRRTPHINVVIDQAHVKQDDALYKWAKHGG